MALDDAQLLDDYVKKASQEAFAELSRRYVNLVYSSALRQMANSHAAEDVTQAVFIVLSRKASGLKRDVILSSWLLQTTSYAVKNARRAELRRRHHEQEAAQMKTMSQEQDEKLWDRISPAIDNAIASLGAPYRDAVVLRYFDGASFEEIGKRLRISEAAARQRISRAVAELREILARQGVVQSSGVSAAAIGGMLGAHAVQNAPTALAGACALAPAAAVAAPLVIAKGVMTMFLIKKILVAASLLLIVLAGVGVVTAVKSGGTTRAASQADKTPPAANNPVQRAAVEGKVVDAGGKPVVGAQVYLADPDHPVCVYGDQQVQLAWIEGAGVYPNLTSYDRKPANRISTTTDAEGKFRFEKAEIRPVAARQEPGLTPPVGTAFGPQDWAVVVGSEQGFAHLLSAEFAASKGRIEISPWGQVEGILLRDGKPRPNAPIRLSRMAHIWENWPFMVQYEDEVKTDEAGHFKFAQVAPGNAWLTYSSSGFAMGVEDPAAYVRVKAGQSHRVDLAPRGRPVIGQLIEPQGARERMIWIDTYHHSSGIMRIESYPVIPQLGTWSVLPPEQKTAMWEQWSATEQGTIYNENLFPILVDVRPDGSLSVPDVPAGKYMLTVSTHHGRPMPALLAALQTVVQVEPVPPGQPAQPQDLGRLTVSMQERLQVGDAAPEFAVPRLDGKGELRLSDYKDKLVLLQFWRSELPVEAMELHYVQRVAALADREKDKLVVLGIGLGNDRERMRTMAEDGGMTWPQGGTEQGSKAVKDYHVGPYGLFLFLIGPDGKILARQISEREIMPAVQKALREMH